jgi:diadenosine tetraphosphate (Ap4A) HIT family hydrolase
MATLFTRIINGELPGRFVWRDGQAVGFLTIAPIKPGHVLVVPRAEIDHWVDLDDGLAAHLMQVARRIGQAQMDVFQPLRVGMIVAGLEVPHCHLHVVPIDSEAELSFARADHNPSSEMMDDVTERLRTALRDRGQGEHVPES